VENIEEETTETETVEDVIGAGIVDIEEEENMVESIGNILEDD